jgi:hypothetical protein
MKRSERQDVNSIDYVNSIEYMHTGTDVALPDRDGESADGLGARATLPAFNKIDSLVPGAPKHTPDVILSIDDNPRQR